MKKGNVIKIILKIIAVLFFIVIVIMCASFLFFKHELKSTATLQKINEDNAYIMTYKGDYKLDKLLKKGVDSDQALIKFISRHFLYGLTTDISSSDFESTAFTVKSPTGEFLTARNFDFSDSPILVLKSNPKNGYRSISTVNLDCVGFNKESIALGNFTILQKANLLATIYMPEDGMNEKGLVISSMQIKNKSTRQNTGKKSITPSSAIRMILDKSATVDEAINLLKQYDMKDYNSTHYFLISDANGKSVVVKYINNNMEIESTNYLITPVNNGNKAEEENHFNIVKKALEENNTMTKEKAMRVLSNAKSILGTRWSVVFDNTSKRVTYSFNADYIERSTFSLKNAHR